jgi:hypothetical protein
MCEFQDRLLAVVRFVLRTSPKAGKLSKCYKYPLWVYKRPITVNYKH